MVGFSLIFVIIFNLKTIFVVFGRNYLRKRYANCIIYSLYIVAYFTHIIFEEIIYSFRFYALLVETIFIQSYLHYMKRYSIKLNLINYDELGTKNYLSCQIC